MESLNFLIIFPIMIFLVFFAIIWLSVCFILAKVSGWEKLARVYRYDGAFSGKCWRFRSCRMNACVSYNNCLAFGANPSGLYMKMLPLFRFHHPPLLIPWSEIQEKKNKGIILHYLELTFTSVPEVRLLIIESLGEKLLSAAKQQQSYIQFRAYQKIEPH